MARLLNHSSTTDEIQTSIISMLLCLKLIGLSNIEGVTRMKEIGIFLLLAAILFAVVVLGIGTPNALAQQPQQPAPTIASAMDREISTIEKEVVEAAKAMPEDKFNFSPEGLNLQGSDYKGVRTFALQAKHIAASNFILWSSLTGDKFPQDYLGGNGPENLKDKAEIIKFLKDSFALGHKAAATLTTENMLQPPGHSKSTRLHLVAFAVAHAFDHYGQMVEYLRMNGIVPPASRKPSN
jgi:uncharacterized damage-inducible protein DinB